MSDKKQSSGATPPNAPAGEAFAPPPYGAHPEPQGNPPAPNEAPESSLGRDLEELLGPEVTHHPVGDDKGGVIAGLLRGVERSKLPILRPVQQLLRDIVDRPTLAGKAWVAATGAPMIPVKMAGILGMGIVKAPFKHWRWTMGVMAAAMIYAGPVQVYKGSDAPDLKTAAQEVVYTTSMSLSDDLAFIGNRLYDFGALERGEPMKHSDEFLREMGLKKTHAFGTGERITGAWRKGLAEDLKASSEFLKHVAEDYGKMPNAWKMTESERALLKVMDDNAAHNRTMGRAASETTGASYVDQMIENMVNDSRATQGVAPEKPAAEQPAKTDASAQKASVPSLKTSGGAAAETAKPPKP
jgi:hypothetical protein